MKKRLRKKRQVAEYQLFCCEVSIYLNKIDLDELFLDAFISECIEEFDCEAGGIGGEQEHHFCIELGDSFALPSKKQNSIKLWLESRPEIDKFSITEVHYIS